MTIGSDVAAIEASLGITQGAALFLLGFLAVARLIYQVEPRVTKWIVTVYRWMRRSYYRAHRGTEAPAGIQFWIEN